MKYLIFVEPKEPREENMEKALKIQEERGKRKKKWDTTGMYHLLSEPKGFMIVETEDESLIAKYIDDYSSVLKMKISPIMERDEWREAIK
jgi:hypothetical protein